MEHESGKRIVFRRIRGHIVPIAVKEGAAIAGAGLGVAAGAGFLSSSLVRSAAYAENHARTVANSYRAAKQAAEAAGPLFAHQALHKLKPVGLEALRSMVVSKQMFAASQGLKSFGRTTAAVAIGAGTFRALEATNLKDNDTARALAGVSAGLGAHFAFRSGFLKGMLRKGTTLAKATREAAKFAIVRKFGGF